MSLETAPTEYIEAAGVRFAYRRLGPREGTPLVFLQHFTGTIESWDPAAVNGLAENRPVIVFDYTGVGTSSGKTPDNVAQMAADAERFIAALGCVQVDLLGFSLGGFVAQVLAVKTPGLVRKMILVGTARREARSTCSRSWRRRFRIRRRLMCACLSSLHPPRRARPQAAPF